MKQTLVNKDIEYGFIPYGLLIKDATRILSFLNDVY